MVTVPMTSVLKPLQPESLRGAGEVRPGVGLEHLEGPVRQGTVSIGLGMIRVSQV